MRFFHSRIFIATVLLQIAGPFFFSFGDWANVIQYVSGFGMAYALWDYLIHHKREMRKLHEKIDSIHEHIKNKEIHNGK